MEFVDNFIKYASIDSVVDVSARIKNRYRCYFQRRKFPFSQILFEGEILANKIAIYFVFNPTGSCLPQNVFMMQSLREQGFSVLVVLAIAEGALISDKYYELCDVLIRKDLGGFDISALQVGLKYLLNNNFNGGVLWINDSVFGLFGDLNKLISDAGDFDVLGMTLSFAIRPHFQSYSFFIKKINKKLFNALFFNVRNVSFDEHHLNVRIFESCFMANLVKFGFKVVCWGVPKDEKYDLILAYPYELIDEGFPFIKRSIVGKFSNEFNQKKILEFFEKHSFHFILE